MCWNVTGRQVLLMRPAGKNILKHIRTAILTVGLNKDRKNTVLLLPEDTNGHFQ